MATKDQLVLDKISLAYHSLKKLFVINNDINEDAIQDILQLYDDVFSTNQVNLDKAYDGNECFIHKLAKQQHYRLIENFIDLGADINAASEDGSTALHYTIQTGDSDTTRKILALLVKNDADLTIKNDNGFSALDLCGYKLSRYVQQLQDANPKTFDHYDFSQDTITNTFNLFDRTKTGFISINEIKDTISKLDLGFNVSDNLIDFMFRLVDTSGDGQLSPLEFESMVKKDINGVQRPVHGNSKLAQLFRKKHIKNQKDIKNIPLDFIFVPRNVQNDVMLMKKNDDKKNDVQDNKQTTHSWTNINPAHSLIDGESIMKILKKCDLNFTKLDRLYQLYFTSNGSVQHSFTTFENFIKGFKNAENKFKKKLKRLFYTFSEEHTKFVNGRLLFICLAGILAQYSTHTATLDDLAKTRTEFVFKLLDVNNQGTVGLFEIGWLLRTASIFNKNEDEILKKSQLILTASGAKGYEDRVKKDAFNEVVLRFPSIVFTKVV